MNVVRSVGSAFLLALLPWLATAAAAQKPGLAAADSVWITPERRYDAGPVHRLLLGDLRRSLWATPVHVPVLDLESFAGGLTPTELGGGQQTRSLRFMSGDGIEYAFRLIDKDASRTLDPELRRSIAASVLQDQIAALLPLAPLVVSPLLESAGVLHPESFLAVLPDDERLGEFRAEFAGVLGFIEERPNEGPPGETGFAGSERVIGSETLFDRLEEDPSNRIDAPAFLRARLLDIFVGDWDRHPDQWRWAGFAEGENLVFRPVPRDRDWALGRIDGILPWMASFAFPHYVGFDDEYPSALSASWAGRALDRQLLAGLEKADWDTVVASLLSRLDDAAIERAVHALPPPYFDQIGANLIAALKQRRNRLPAMAEEYYRVLAGWTDIEMTDLAETAALERIDGRTLRVRIRATQSGAVTFARMFHADDTHEVRVFLRGGADRAVASGANAGDIVIRIVGGGGDDVLIDQTGGAGVFLYDDRGENTIESGPGTRFDDLEWVQPIDSSAIVHMADARDWGSRWIPVPSIASEPDLGLYVGFGAIRWGYGFREYPWRTRLAFNVGIGTTTGRPRFDLTYEFHLTRDVNGRIETSGSGVERTRFYGFGNETREDRDDTFYHADRSEFIASAVAVVKPYERTEIALGPTVRLARHDPTTATLLDSVSAYGTDGFNQVGATVRFRFDSRNVRRAASRGAFLELDGKFVPSLLDVATAWGSLSGQASTYVSAPILASPTLALRLGGEKIWGEPPYFEAASIGGSENVRGFSRQRFLGHASAFANAELRFRVTDFFLLLPGTLGLFGLADSGRVFAHGEESDRWHSAAGGGIWLSFLSPANTMSLALARSSERTGVYLRAGFLF